LRWRWRGWRIVASPTTSPRANPETRDAAVFEWVYNTKRITGEFVRALLGLRVVTNPGP
jgi:hypothetical protein